MNASGKWLSIPDPATPASDIAEQALRERLRYVRRLMKQTAGNDTPGDEDVHQLRVATRRAAAALEIFADCLPWKRGRRLRRRLRELRQAAGAIRDLDIVSMRLADRKPSLDPEVTRQFKQHLSKLRQREQKKLRKKLRDRTELKRQSRRLVAKIRWRGDGDEPTIRELAERAMTPVTGKFAHAVATCDWTAPSLHRLRIAAKRLRYSTELLRSVLDEGALAEIYPHLSEIQQRLGDLNDHAMTCNWCERAADACPNAKWASGLRELAAGEEQKLTRDIEAFRAWWSDNLDESLTRKLSTLSRATSTTQEVPAAH